MKGLFSRDVVYYEISADGKVTHEVPFEMPYHCMLHDFGVTEHYAIFPIIPSCGVGEEALKAGNPHYAWDSTKDVYLGVLPRGGAASDLRWFKAPNQFCSHVMNAFDDGTRVYIDVPRAEGNMFPFVPEIGKPWDPSRAASRLTRWCVERTPGYHGSGALFHPEECDGCGRRWLHHPGGHPGEGNAHGCFRARCATYRRGADCDDSTAPETAAGLPRKLGAR